MATNVIALPVRHANPALARIAQLQDYIRRAPGGIAEVPELREVQAHLEVELRKLEQAA